MFRYHCVLSRLEDNIHIMLANAVLTINSSKLYQTLLSFERDTKSDYRWDDQIDDHPTSMNEALKLASISLDASKNFLRILAGCSLKASPTACSK